MSTQLFCADCLRYVTGEEEERCEAAGHDIVAVLPSQPKEELEATR